MDTIKGAGGYGRSAEHRLGVLRTSIDSVRAGAVPGAPFTPGRRSRSATLVAKKQSCDYIPRALARGTGVVEWGSSLTAYEVDSG
jgi:hypothetical protein